MKSWKDEELQRFYAALKEAEQVRAPFETMRHAAAQLLFPSKPYVESSFESKRALFRQASHTIAISDVEDGEILRDIAIAWAEVNLHSDVSDDDWFEASVDYIFQLGRYCESLSGVKALLWNYELGKELCIWQAGILSRIQDEKGEYVERLLRQRIGGDTHPTLSMLLYIPNIFDGLGSLICSDKCPTRWLAFVFFGRLLYTHALCNGIARLDDSNGLWPHLSMVNGVIASWPYPWANDRKRTITLMEKMGAPHYHPQVDPGYFESEVWCERLRTAARAYLENFRRVFYESGTPDTSNTEAWKGMASALQVFSELVFVYEIGVPE